MLQGDSESRRRSCELRDSTSIAAAAGSSFPAAPSATVARGPDIVPACVNADPLPPELRLGLGCCAVAPVGEIEARGASDTDMARTVPDTGQQRGLRDLARNWLIGLDLLTTDGICRAEHVNDVSWVD